MLTSFLDPKVTITLIAAGFTAFARPDGFIRDGDGGWRLADDRFSWEPERMPGLAASHPRKLKAIPAVTHAEALDWLVHEKGARYGFYFGADGQASFSIPTDNPYKFRRNSSDNPDRCLDKGIERILETLKKSSI